MIYCRKCDYPLDPKPSQNCSECGAFVNLNSPKSYRNKPRRKFSRDTLLPLLVYCFLSIIISIPIIGFAFIIDIEIIQKFLLFPGRYVGSYFYAKNDPLFGGWAIASHILFYLILGVGVFCFVRFSGR